MIKILAIDNNDDYLISIKAMLKDLFTDIMVLTAPNGPAGIEIAAEEDPDVILLDIVIPGMDGFEACRRLKKDDRVKDIPVVFLTALKGENGNRIKALELGAEGFLAKPIDETELIAQIRAMVKIKRANEYKRDEKIRLNRLVAERTEALEKELIERKRAEKQLHESREDFRQIVERANDVFFRQDISTLEFEYVSPKVYNMLRYTPEEFLRLKFKDLQLRIHSDERWMILRLLDDLLVADRIKHKYIEREFRLKNKKGDYRWIQGNFTLLRNLEDQPYQILGCLTDITDRKKAENTLRESEFFFKESQRAAFVGSYKFDLSANLWTSSEILDQIFGIDTEYPRTLEGWLFIAHPEDREMMATYFTEEVVAKRISFNKEYRIIRKTDGETRWVLGLGKLISDEQGNIISMMGTIQDITERIHVRNALAENELKYRELFEANTDSIAIFLIKENEISNFIDCNENNAKLLGYTKEEIFNLSPAQIEIPIGKELLEFRIGELLEKGQVDFETKLVHKTGTLIDVEIKALLVKYNNQPAIMNISRDITKRKLQAESLRQSNELNQSLLQTIPFGMNIVDEFGNILFMNENFKNHFSKDVIGKKCWTLYRDNGKQCEDCPLLTGIKIGETKFYESTGVMGGKTFQISHTGMMFQGKKTMLEIFQDITEMRKSRIELIAAKEQAEESNNLKSAFLNNMSHEIRTPMNHIMGFSSLMSEAKDAEKDRYAEIILNSSNQLLTLIENVILLSRLQSEKLELNRQVFGPNSVLQSLVEMFKPNCDKKNIVINIQQTAANKNRSILSDHEKIRQILINLTSNAVKYTSNGFIEIGYELQRNSAKFYVRDSGMGIPIHEQIKIFDSFYRSEQAIYKAIGGTGLGLSIVKELVKSMNGSISLESEPGKGSCFYFTIPVEIIESNLEDVVYQLINKELKEITILIADDEQINYLYLEILLKSIIKRIDYVSNGLEALEMVSKNNYDLILMDLKMPEMDGYEATKMIKEKFPSLPIIAQTAYATIEDKEKAMKAGCDNFIAKPIKKDALVEMIQLYC